MLTALWKKKKKTEQFESVFTPCDNSPPPELNGKPYDTITEIIVKQGGITKLLKKTHDPSKACDPNYIPTVVLMCRQHSPCHDSHLPKIPQHQNPAHWLAETVKVSVSCAFKKGDRNLAENYRLISLTSVSCKILEHIYHHLMTCF